MKEIINKLNVLDSTKKCYISDLDYLTRYNIDWIIDKEDQNLICETIYNTFDTLLRIKKSLNICIVIRNGLGLDSTIVRAQRKNVISKINETTSSANIKLKKKDISLENLIEDLSSYCKSPVASTKKIDRNKEINNYTKFIINYLIIFFQCRNLDLDLVITRDRPGGIYDNYLYVKPDEVVFIRNFYKTSKNYGQKTRTITNKDFVLICNKLTKNGDYDLIPEHISNVNNFIKVRTCFSLGQGAIAKVVVANSSISDLKQISDNRGTDINTLLNYYDIFKKDIKVSDS